MKEKIVLVSGAVIYKTGPKGKVDWLIVKSNEDSDWEIPKAVARRGESSVRAIMRLMIDQASMNAKVLEEVGRHGGATKVNGNPVSQKTIYYLMMFEQGGEIIGFADSIWLEYGKAVRKLGSKKDEQMLKDANKLKKELDRERRKNQKPELDIEGINLL